MKKIGENLKNARKFLGLTQIQVANVLKVTRKVIANIENNNRSIKSDELYKFSKLYGVSTEELIEKKNKSDWASEIFEAKLNLLSTKDRKEILSIIKFKNGRNATA